ncbi:hypothetical protein CDL15_Pgr016628 [Punica granatum]|nr:hypothetical protein CDL15_Pgr016628 [Punica granatum]
MILEEEEEGEVVVREYSESRDRELVGKLEKKCEVINNGGSRINRSKANSKSVSISTNTISDDPSCRIRLYTVRVMLVAELQGNGEVVGVVRGCIKNVYVKNTSTTTANAGIGRRCVKLGCMLGLRVSPAHRRMGIGSKLVQSLEDWMAANGAQYALLATEKTNTAAMNLFIAQRNYTILSSLVIYMCPISSKPKEQPQHIRTDKLLVDQAISFYEKRLKCKDVFPADISSILKEKLSLGTWISYFGKGVGTKGGETNNLDFIEEEPSSWVIFSVWNTSEAYKLQIRKSHEFKFFSSTLKQAYSKILPCLKLPAQSSVQEPFGFLFLYGLLGEGERVGELIKHMWDFTARLAINLKDCRVVLTELGATDPLREHVSLGPCTTCINDVWCLKKLVRISKYGEDRGEDLAGKRAAGNVFVDPRDF